MAAWRAPSGAFGGGAGLVAFAGAQLVAFTVLGALWLAWARGARLVQWLRHNGVFDPERRLDGAAVAVAALTVMPVAVALGACAVFGVARAFANRELAALLAACLVALATALGLVASAALALGVTAWRARAHAGARSLPWALPIAVAGSLALLEAVTGLTGVTQLDPGLLATPLLAAAAVALSRRLDVGRRGNSVALLAPVALGAAAALAPVDGAALLARYGAWSRSIVPWLRALTDRDDARFGGDGDGTPPITPPRPSGRKLPGLPARPNVVLVTIETLRADHVSFLGYSRPTTPRLAELAAQSVVFERLYATTPTTRLSLPALLSGVLPSHLDWQPQPADKHMRRVGPRTPWLPEILQRQGYATIAVHASFRAFTALESAGFDRGFERYDTSTELHYRGGTMRGFPGGRQVDRALELVSDVSGRPFFLWLHLLEPHYLYQQPPDAPRFGTTERDLYDAEIHEADRQVGRLIDGLVARDAWAHTVFLVTGDHGEEFGEHGERWHTSNLYEPQVRTAGLLRIPGVEPRRVSAAVTLIDFTPTLLDLLGLPQPLEQMHGRNLIPLLHGEAAPLPPFFLENFRVHDGGGYQLGVVAYPHKLLYREDDASLELYHVEDDPAERRALPLDASAAARELASLLHRFRESRPAPR